MRAFTRDTRALSHDVGVSIPCIDVTSHDACVSTQCIDASTRDTFKIKHVKRDSIHVASDLIRLTHVFIQDMSDTVQHILDLSERLRELRGQLDRLDAERAAVRQQIEECMAQMGPGSDEEPMPEGMAQQIRWALRRHRDRPLAPVDVATMLRLTSQRDVGNVRTLLARMARDGRARKVAHGRYVTTE
jgi:septal ring factor EnvC (AmiA/AmiB activator)